jgi:hypothetical protein
LLSDAHFLQRGESVVCVVGADAKEFIALVNSTPSPSNVWWLRCRRS